MTFEEMKKIVVDTLNCDEDKVTMEASLTEDLEADSLDAVELNMALEDACGVSIPDEELAKLRGRGQQGARLVQEPTQPLGATTRFRVRRESCRRANLPSFYHFS